MTEPPEISALESDPINVPSFCGLRTVIVEKNSYEKYSTMNFLVVLFYSVFINNTQHS